MSPEDCFRHNEESVALAKQKIDLLLSMMVVWDTSIGAINNTKNLGWGERRRMQARIYILVHNSIVGLG